MVPSCSTHNSFAEPGGPKHVNMRFILSHVAHVALARQDILAALRTSQLSPHFPATSLLKQTTHTCLRSQLMSMKLKPPPCRRGQMHTLHESANT